MTFRPIKVIAHMGEPVVYYGDGMYLDGLLAMAVYRDLPRSQREALPYISSPWVDDFMLPLDRWQCQSTTHSKADDRLFVETPERTKHTATGLLWGWKASSCFADWTIQASHEVRKKPAHEKMIQLTDAGSLLVAGGPFKPRDLRFPTRFAPRIEWYAVGDAAEIDRLLSVHISHLGKLASHGMGKVIGWEVEPCSEDWSIERNKKLTRNMPASWPVKGASRSVGAIRPPYHHPSKRVDIVQPVFEEMTP